MTTEQMLRDWGATVSATPSVSFGRDVRRRAHRRRQRTVAVQAAAMVGVVAVGVTSVVQLSDGSGARLTPAAEQDGVRLWPSDSQLAAGRFLFSAVYTVEVIGPGPDQPDRALSLIWTDRAAGRVYTSSTDEGTDGFPTMASLGTRTYTWDELATLPTDAEGWRALLTEAFSGSGSAPAPGEIARQAAFLSGESPLPTAQRAAIEQMIATSAGAVDRGTVRDGLGRPARQIAFPDAGMTFSFSKDHGVLQTELVDRGGQVYSRSVRVAYGLVSSRSQSLPFAGEPAPLPVPSRPLDKVDEVPVTPRPTAPERNGPVPTPPAACQDEPRLAGVCRVVRAVHTGDVGALEGIETFVASTAQDLPYTPWRLDRCDKTGESVVVGGSGGAVERFTCVLAFDAEGGTRFAGFGVDGPPPGGSGFSVTEYLGLDDSGDFDR